MPMQTDVAGRVRNVTLPASKPLLPLYESIVNSVQAIEDVKDGRGQIEIVVVRDDNHLFQDQDRSLGEIVGFDVSDNGIGFTDENFHAFETADTTFKADRGGKGVGRFLWLVAFNRVEIESVFLSGDEASRRSFVFVAEDDGIKNMECSTVETGERRTTIRLRGFVARFQKTCPKRLETIATHVIEHCLEFFIRADCPRVLLRDGSSGEEIDLNSFFEKEMVAKSTADEFEVKGHKFIVTHVRLYATHTHEHLAHFCANDRDVTAHKLRGRIPDLGRELQSEDGRRFFYAGYVEGELLNETVNSERTAFNIENEESPLTPEDLTWADLRRAVEEQAQVFLAPYTEPVKAQKQERINRFLATDGPMYRPIMKYIDDKIGMIDPDADDDQLDLQLYEAYHHLQVELKSEGKQLLDTESDSATDLDEYTEKLQTYFDKVTDVNAADLARYVCHRRAVLDFLHKQLSRRDDATYPLEDRVHSIIFPMGATSDEIPLDGHNLWIIDEKLAYHAFLASDKQLRTLAPLTNDSQKEPDIIVFDTACAFVPSTDPPFPAVVIVEFKRAMRDDYTMKKNPFVQVREYITEIRDGKARTPDGRDVPVQHGVPFYCYIVCDMGPRLEQWAKDFELEKTPDGQGFFGYKRHYNAYIEVISYTKMVTDAKKRNAVLFDKLGLPSRVTG